jgi:hypothetical protein
MAGLLALLSIAAALQAPAPDRGDAPLAGAARAIAAFPQSVCPPGIPPLLPSVALNQAPPARLRPARQTASPGLEIFEPPCVALVRGTVRR